MFGEKTAYNLKMILSVVVSIALCAAMVPVVAFADDEISPKNQSVAAKQGNTSVEDETADEPTVPDSGWSIEGTTLTIAGEGVVEKSSSSVTYKRQARKIVISEGVTKIGQNVFQSFSSVEEVSFPTTLTSIGEGAFKGCSSLTSVTMASVESIGRDAFEDCTQLTSIILPKTLSNLAAFAFSGCDKLKTVEFLGSVPDDESVGLSLSSETQVIFPANDQTWTDDARTRFSGNPDKLYLRNEDGSLTKVPYGGEQNETEVPFGGSETVSIKGSPSGATFSFSVPSDMTVRIYFGYWRCAVSGFFSFKLIDPEGAVLHERDALSTMPDSKGYWHGALELPMSAGEHHVSVSYLGKLVVGLAGTFTVGVSSASGSSEDTPGDGSGNGDESISDIKVSVKGDVESGVKVNANLGGANIQNGAEAIIEVKPSATPSEIAKTITGRSLGAYEVNLFVKNPGDEEAHQIHDGFGDISLSFPVGSNHSGRNVRLHHLHEGIVANQGPYAEYAFTMSGVPARCKIVLTDDGLVDAYTLTVNFALEQLASKFAKAMRDDYRYDSRMSVSQPSSTSVSIHRDTHGTGLTLSALKNILIKKSPDLTVVAEKLAGSSARLTSHEVSVNDSYATLQVTDLSVFAVEEMVTTATSGSGSSQAAGTQQLVPTGKVGGSMVNSGDSVGSLGIVAMIALAVVSITSVVSVLVSFAFGRRKVHR